MQVHDAVWRRLPRQRVHAPGVQIYHTPAVAGCSACPNHPKYSNKNYTCSLSSRPASLLRAADMCGARLDTLSMLCCSTLSQSSTSTAWTSWSTVRLVISVGRLSTKSMSVAPCSSGVLPPMTVTLCPAAIVDTHSQMLQAMCTPTRGPSPPTATRWAAGFSMGLSMYLGRELRCRAS